MIDWIVWVVWVVCVWFVCVWISLLFFFYYIMKNNRDTSLENFLDSFSDDEDTEFEFDDAWIDDYMKDDIEGGEQSLDNDANDDNDVYIDKITINEYHSKNKCIKAYFLYIEKDPGTLTTINTNTITLIKNKYVYYDNYLSKSTIIDLIKEYSHNDDVKYKLYYILKYQNTFTNKDLERFLSGGDSKSRSEGCSEGCSEGGEGCNEGGEGCSEGGEGGGDISHNFLTVYKKLDDIYIDNLSLDIFTPLTSLYFIFIKPVVQEKHRVVPSLKIPYSDNKSERKSRINKKSLISVKPTKTRRK